MAVVETVIALDAKLETEVPPQSTNSDGVRLESPEELIARGIAPVKSEYRRPPPLRNNQDTDAVADDRTKASNKVIEKKSKRQLKRERLQEKNSTIHLCPEIARTGVVSSCPFSDKCRFSHDIEAYKAQKPADIVGVCPFADSEIACTFGLACRFLGSHKDTVSAGPKRNVDTNPLKKDVQRLLWKNKMTYPKADAVLKSFGLLHVQSKRKTTEDDDEGDSIGFNPTNGNGTTKAAHDDSAVGSEPASEAKKADNPEETCASDGLQPLKKAKSENAEIFCSDKANDGIKAMKEENVKCSPSTDSDDAMEIIISETDGTLKVHPREKKLIDFRDKLYLAPLTTVGNLPFRRVCKFLGADITCGEMAMCTSLLQGQASEWALLRRHPSEDLFGVQICGSYPDTVARTVELIDQECSMDFIDINMGCPIDLVVNKGAGSALLTKPMRMKSIVKASCHTVETPITLKVRTAYFEGKNRIDSLIAEMSNWGATALTIHGRSRQQRYIKQADWDYIYQCVKKAPDTLQVVGNGDVFSYLDWNKHKSDCPELSTCMIARGALVKPWIFTEIKEQRHWDITSAERLNIFKDFVRFGLQHWGSDTKGVETTRHFLLEWLSYTCRYVPVGLLDVLPQRVNWRPPSYCGRDDLETLLASDAAGDWVRITEMLLGKVPEGFTFAPKHKSNAYDRAENG